MMLARRRWQVVSLIALTLGASVMGLKNGFTYDDRYIIETNDRVHHLAGIGKLFLSTYWPPSWGGDGYRPFTMLAYTLEWVAGDGAPWIFHAVNIALYVVATLGVFALTVLMLPEWAAWTAAALFSVHPVHVEAVANVVGQSELWAGCAITLGVFLFLRARRKGALSPGTACSIVALYALACLSKEHGIVFPALLVLAELLVVSDARALRVRLVEMRPFALALLLVAVAFLAARSRTLEFGTATGFQPFIAFTTLGIDGSDRVLTMLNVVPDWFRLLLWPAHLASEYAPREIEIAQGLSVSQIPGFLLLTATLGLTVASWRRLPIVTFGMSWFCVTLLPSSNFIIPAGIILAERTLFLPSVGAMIVIAALAHRIAARARGIADGRALRVAAVLLTCGLLTAGLVRSTTRSMVWRDNDRLFHQAVADSPLNYRAHYVLGAHYFDNQRRADGERELKRALELFPYDPYVSLILAEQYQAHGLCEPAITYFQWSFRVQPNFGVGRTALARCLLIIGEYDESIQQALIALGRGGNIRTLHSMISSADSARKTKRSGDPQNSARGTAGKVPESMQKAAGIIAPESRM